MGPLTALGGGLPLGTGVLPDTAALDSLPQVLLAVAQFGGTDDSFLSEFEKNGPDAFFWVYIVLSIIIVTVAFYLITRPYWEQRWLIEKVNAAKLKFITAEKDTTPIDKYELGRLYVQLPDFPSALAEYEEAEEDFDGLRRVLDPEDAMGALATRAMLHNSKGYALTNLEPPRTAQARREYVRAVTYWPEYPEGLLNIGRELIKRKRYDVAVRTLSTALKWQPASVDIQKAHEEARSNAETSGNSNADDDDDED